MITGNVTDSTTGQGLPQANVYYSDGNGNILANDNLGTATDQNGQYSIERRPGKWLTASYTGYGKKTVKVGAQESISFLLKPGVTLPGVTITADKPKTWLQKNSQMLVIAMIIALIIYILYKNFK